MGTDARAVTTFANCKKADQSFTSDTTLANLTDLSFRTEGQNKVVFRACLFIDQAGGTAGVKVAISGPASPTNIEVVVQSDGAGGTNRITAFASPISLGQAAGKRCVEIFGTIEIGVVQGTISIQAAQSVSDAGATTIERGSYIEMKVVG